MRKILIFFGVLTVIAAGELFCRFVIGLGTPPLYQTDALLEYRLKPNQRVYRFGNLIEANERGMRSPTLIDQQRDVVLVLGDSVLYGGSQVDQSELATSLLSNAGTLFANFSASSWGPANMTAALKESQDFAKTAIVVVLNSDDLSDVPVFGPLTIDQPSAPVTSALWEALSRYAPRFIPNFLNRSTALTSRDIEDQLNKGAKDMDGMLILMKSQTVPSCVVLHPRKSEIESEKAIQFEDILQKVTGSGVRFIDARTDAPANLDQAYSDDIHLTATGQKWLAGSIEKYHQKEG